MAWKSPVGARKNAPATPKLEKKASSSNGNFPGLKPEAQANPKVGGPTHYEELQQNEVMVLKAIYTDDFVEQKAAQGAWHKSAEPTFDIIIKAGSNEDFAITLGVVLVASYPKSPPLLTIKKSDGLRDSTKFKIQKYLETQPKLFAAEETEMIDRIVEGIRDMLEDAARAEAQGLKLPSLEEERAAHEAETAARQAEAKELEDRKKLQETEEEERVLGDMLQEELKRQRTKAKESRMKSRTQHPLPSDGIDEETPEAEETIAFDHTCRIEDSNGNTMLFNRVTRKELFCTGPYTTIYKVKPVLAAKQLRPSLVLKHNELRTGKDAAHFKKQLQALESALEAIKKVRHRNVLDIIDFRIDREASEAETGLSSSPRWSVTILLPLAEKGPLDELLHLAGHIALAKARSWVADLLEALGFLHTHGIIHQDLHSGNILLFREPTGDIVPKIADASYQREVHNICSKKALTSTRTARSAYWYPPEIASVSKPQYTQKTDVWDFGIISLQMMFGMDIVQKCHSPTALMESLSLSAALHEMVSKLFKNDPKKRPRAFDLGNSEFLATDAGLYENDDSALMTGTFASMPQSISQRHRRSSTSAAIVGNLSRYQQEYVEEARLGKGGFGEVVRARNVLNGQLYAVKKITQRSQDALDEIIKEVRYLAKLNHPAVVRYYHMWLEGGAHGGIGTAKSSSTGPSTVGGYDEDSDDGQSQGTVSQPPPEIDVVFANDSGEVAHGVDVQYDESQSRGLDFMSSSGHPFIEFGYDTGEDEENAEDDTEAEDDDDEEDEDDEGDDDEDATPYEDDSPKLSHSVGRRKSAAKRPFQTTMYISMEYCEKKTLRNLIDQNIYENSNEVWRLLRQIVEGLVHIHGINIVHRDLKPENIFISGVDGLDNVKIGDFGLATSGQLMPDKSFGSSFDTGDMTRSVGTTAYIAPEIRTTGTGSYTAKVDMYSLGVIFFEMSYPSMTRMERAMVLEKIRQSPAILPLDFKSSDKNHVEVILSLLNHNPHERPSSVGLLRSGKIPDQMESETITRALAGLADPSSPYYQRVIDTLFAKPNEQARDYAWDMTNSGLTPTELMRQFTVRQTLVSIFRRHGAVEGSRTSLYPKSSHYGENAVQLVDKSGTVLQLPFDLMMGHARSLARVSNGPLVQYSYSFGNIYRPRLGGGQPIMFGEVDFDIVTADAFDLALKEAEILKILDEICSAFPTTASTSMCFYLGHSHLLDCIFEFCEIQPSRRRATAEALSKLNIRNYPWSRMRAELRSELVGISATSVDELQRFDFRDSPSKAQTKLKGLLEGSEAWDKVAPTLAHLKEVSEYAKRFGVTRKIYISPLSSINEAFFKGGFLFSCLYDKKVKDVFAAGGRYDSLIREHRPKIGGRFDERHAVGFSLNWEKHLAQHVPKTMGKAFLKKSAEEDSQGIFNAKRCDVLIGSFDQTLLRSDGVELLSTLWANDFTAELAKDARSPEQLMYGLDSYSWIVVVKKEKMLKIKIMGRKDAQDVDLPMKELVSWLRAEYRNNRGVVSSLPTSSHASGAGETGPTDSGRSQDVRVLVAQTKSKKFNRHAVVGEAQAAAARLVSSFLDGNIAAIETSDMVMDLLRTATRLSDAETWRRVEQTVGGGERQYIRDVHDMLRGWRDEATAGKGSMHAFVYNFRTGSCLYYDLGA